MRHIISLGWASTFCKPPFPCAETGGLPILYIARLTRVWVETI